MREAKPFLCMYHKVYVLDTFYNRNNVEVKEILTGEK